MTEHADSKGKELTIFCLANGEPTSRAIPLTVLSTQTVGHLKILFKENRVELSDINADELTLWLVSVAVADYSYAAPILLDTLQGQRLHPTTKLENVFGHDARADSVHIIVQRPQA
ncbi:hypothetical protein BGX28_008655, partial [Mortierella sp. GBA30]